MKPSMSWVLMAWIAAIVFLYPIPHTIALRNLILLAGLPLLAIGFRQAPRPHLPAALKASAWWLTGLTVWIVLQAVTVSATPSVALANLRGDWIVPLLTGTLAAWIAYRLKPSQALTAIIAPLILHMLWMHGWQASLRSQGVYAIGVTPFGGYDHHSTLSAFLIAMLLADRLAWLLSRTSPCGSITSNAWLLTAATLVSDIFIRARNGTLVVLALVAAMLMLLLANTGTRRKATPWAVLTLLSVGALAAATWHNDPRWRGLSESAAVGWNSPSLYWLNMNDDPAARPATPSGAPLEESAYGRAAWAHQAITGIAEHPLGLGFGRDGFGQIVAQRYGHAGMVSSHSGWLDFTLAVGLPGLVLLLATGLAALHGGWRLFRKHDEGIGLMFSFLVGSYLLRGLLDGHLSGWRLGLFAFLCGTLIGAMRPKP